MFRALLRRAVLLSALLLGCTSAPAMAFAGGDAYGWGTGPVGTSSPPDFGGPGIPAWRDPVPVALPPGVTVKSIAVADPAGTGAGVGGEAARRFAVTSDGNLLSWGYGSTAKPAPLTVQGGGPVEGVSASDYFALAFNSQRGGGFWQLGHRFGPASAVAGWDAGTFNFISTPGTLVVQAAAGNQVCNEEIPDCGSNHDFALLLENLSGVLGRVVAYGDDTYGQLGSMGANGSTTPVTVPVPKPAKAIAAGDAYGLALATDGTVYEWGLVPGRHRNGGGALNQPTVTWAPTQVALPGGVHATAIWAAARAAYALGSNGVLYRWGEPLGGQCPSTLCGPYSPTAVSLPAGVTAVDVAAGLDYQFVLGSDGAIYADGVGNGSYSQANLGTWVANGNGYYDPNHRVQLPAGTVPEAVGLTYAITAPQAEALTTDPPATNITYSSATLQGTEQLPSGVQFSGVTCGFLVAHVQDMSAAWQVPGAPCASKLGNGATVYADQGFTGAATGLKPDTPYWVEATVTAGGITHQGAATHFQTPGGISVTTNPPTNIGSTGAQLSATVTAPTQPVYTALKCQIQIATDPGFPSATTTTHDAGGACNPTGASTFTYVPTNLTPGTSYYFRGLVTADGRSYYADNYRSFATLPSGSNPGGPGSGPTVGPPVTTPLPSNPHTGGLSTATCQQGTQEIRAWGGAFEITGCIYGDNAGHYVVEGPFTMNGLAVSPVGDPERGHGATFICPLSDPSYHDCAALQNTFTAKSAAGKVELSIDVPASRIDANSQVTISTGSTLLYQGSVDERMYLLNRPVDELPGTTFAPSESGGYDTNSGPVIVLPVSGTHMFHGLPMTGELTLNPQGQDGTEIGINVTLPFFGATAGNTFLIDAQGREHFTGMSFNYDHLGIPHTPIDLGSVSFSFDTLCGCWQAGATLNVPGLNIGVGVTLSIKDNYFPSAQGSVTGLNYPLVPEADIFLQDITAGFGTTSNGGFSLNGRLGLSIGPSDAEVMRVSGGFGEGFNYPHVAIGPLGDIIPDPLDIGTVPFVFNLNADQGTELEGFPIVASTTESLYAWLPPKAPLLAWSAGLGTLGGKGCNLANPSTLGSCTPQGIEIDLKGVPVLGVHSSFSAIYHGTTFDGEGAAALELFKALDLSGRVLLSNYGIIGCATFAVSPSVARDQAAAAKRSSNAAGSNAAGSNAARSNAAAEQNFTDGFASSVANRVQPRALLALRGSARKSRRQQLLAHERKLKAQIAAYRRRYRAQVRAIVAAGKAQVDALAVSASTMLGGTARGYRSGLLTQRGAGGLVVSQAASASAQLQTVESRTKNALQALEQTVQGQMDVYAQELGSVETALKLLGSGATTPAAARDRLRAQTANIFDDALSGLEDAGSWIAHQAEDFYGACKDAAKHVVGALHDALTAIPGIAAAVQRELDAGLHALGKAVAVLGQQALANLDKFAALVRAGLVYVIDKILSAVFPQVGVGYHWGANRIDFFPPGTCNVSAYADLNGLTPSRDRAHAAGATLHLNGGSPVVLRFQGTSAPPLVRLTGPHGFTLTTPSLSHGHATLEDSGQAVVIADITSNATYMQFTPKTGQFTVATEPGSGPITATSRAGTLPEPAVSASVTGQGARHVLHWRAARIPGQHLQFIVEDGGAPKTIVSTAAPAGVQAFTLTPGPAGLRPIEVQVTQNGKPRTAAQVASVDGPVASAPGAIARITLSRIGRTVLVRWTRSVAASRYQLALVTTGGVSDTVETRATSFKVVGVDPAETVVVQITGVDAGGRPGPTAEKALAGAGASSCNAPAVVVALRASQALTAASASLNGVPVAQLSRGTKRITVPLAGATGSKAVLRVVALTASHRKLTASHVFHLCSSRPVPRTITLRLR